MAFLEQIGLSPCLADDMGLGKTMQVISLLLAQPGVNPALLIAPTSVIGNWEREIQKFAPTLKVLLHHGVGRSKDNETQFDNVNLVVTSFGLCRRDQVLFSWSKMVTCYCR